MREPLAGPASPASPSPLPFRSPAGQTVDLARPPPQVPDHELLRLIGHGAYGEVWLARSVVGTLRAVKVVHRHDFEEEHPFDREFKGIQKFEPISRSHPGVVNILQIGRNEAEGYFYYVMELADDAGNPKSEIRDPKETRNPKAEATPESTQVRASDFGLLSGFGLRSSDLYTPRTLRSDLKLRGRLPFDECLQIGLSLTSALEHLHQHGLVHRDVKPSNIIFVDGQPKLADIGLVAGVDEARSFVGTAGFIPPEGPGRPQADLYSLGIVLYVMSTGKRHDAYPEPLSDLDSDPDHQRWLELNAVIHTACHADPRERYQTAGDMHSDLLRLQAGKPVRRRVTLRRAAERTKRVWPVLAAAVLLLLALPWLARRQGLAPPPVPTEKASVFVLPFRSEGSNAVPNDLCGRITDAFIDSLALIEGVRRSPRKSGWVHQDESMLCQSLAKTNDMRYILTGRISGSGDDLNLTLHLNKRGEAAPVWSQSFSGNTNQVVALEQRALVCLAEVLGLRITGNEQQKIDRLLASNQEALKWMRQADAAYQNQAGTQVGFLEIQRLAQKAKELDPNYVDADFQDVLVLRDVALNRASRESWPSIGVRLEKILGQDDTHAGALDQMCGYTLFYSRDWAALWPWVERLLAASEPQRREWLAAMYYRVHGWSEEAWMHQRRSENPEPIDFVQLFHLAGSRRVDRLWAESVQAARRVMDLYPSNSFGYHALAYGLIGGGDFEQGIEATWKVAGAYQQEMTALRGYAFAKMGQPDKAREILSEFTELSRKRAYVQPYVVARIQAALGENEAALEWLEKAELEKSEYLMFPDVGGLRTDPAWDGLQNEPRYRQLCDRLGLGKNQWPRPKPERMP
ncbi:MAG TPA: protein kinase [Verrucomicrobiae bacterium]